MAKARTVVRTYYNKKLGKMVTKTYTYNTPRNKHKSSKKKITTSTGRLVKTNVNRLVKQGYNEWDIKAEVAIWNKEHPGKALSSTRLEYRLNRNKVLNFIDNTGLSVNQITQELGVSEDVLLDQNNWNGNTFTDPVSGKTWTVSMDYNYDGEVSSVFTAAKSTMTP